MKRLLVLFFFLMPVFLSAQQQYNWNDNVIYNESVYKLYTTNITDINPPGVGTEPTKSNSLWFKAINLRGFLKNH